MSVDDVRNFNEKFNVPMASRPSLLCEELFDYRTNFMVEELTEFINGHESGDLHEAADALVDLVYVVYGTALMMGLPWGELWTRVHDKNMEKVLANSAIFSKRGSEYDVIKPAHWTPPDHSPSLGERPWPIFNPVKTERESG